MRQEVETQTPVPQPARIKIVRVRFKDADGKALPADLRFIKTLKKFQWDDRDDWADELQQRVTDEWRHRGYFQALSEIRPRLLSSSPQEQRYEVTIVLEPQHQYRLSRILFVHNTHFNATYLRSLFPIHMGEVFDTRKLRQGLENLRNAYNQDGFINSTAIPEPRVDERRRQITLAVDVDEGNQYRLGQITVRGLDQNLTDKLLHRFGLESGTVFNPRNLDLLFHKGKEFLPADANASDDVERHVDDRSSTVSLTFNFMQPPTCTWGIDER